jgi:hypothetical protein
MKTKSFLTLAAVAQNLFGRPSARNDVWKKNNRLEK